MLGCDWVGAVSDIDSMLGLGKLKRVWVPCSFWAVQRRVQDSMPGCDGGWLGGVSPWGPGRLGLWHGQESLHPHPWPEIPGTHPLYWGRLMRLESFLVWGWDIILNGKIVSGTIAGSLTKRLLWHCYSHFAFLISCSEHGQQPKNSTPCVHLVHVHLVLYDLFDNNMMNMYSAILLAQTESTRHLFHGVYSMLYANLYRI